jgi:hypothetical protein
VAATLRQKVGCWVFERWRAEAALRIPVAGRLGLSWLDLRNRHERLERTANDSRRCLWADSSFLTVARVFPRVGGRLLARGVHEWPFRMADPNRLADSAPDPELSVVLPVGGDDRIRLLRPVLSAFAGQLGARVEVVIVEHATTPSAALSTVPGIRRVHLPREERQEFNKSQALNAGVRASRAPFLLLHDGDIIPPQGYARTVVDVLREGWEAIRPLRFLFHFEEGATERFITSGGADLPMEQPWVQQNNPGASTAMTRAAYDRIGGHDESFRGWGGEDLEFLDRLQTVRLFPGAFVPAIHLWHAAAPRKASGDRNLAQTAGLRAVPVAERIARLTERQRGR